jgi:hypothetical protein
MSSINTSTYQHSHQHIDPSTRQHINTINDIPTHQHINTSTQRKIWNLPTGATQIDCILFCRAVKIFGIYRQKQLTVAECCSAAHEKNLNCDAEKILELRPKALYFVSRAEKILEFTNKQKQLKLTAFCYAAQPKLTVCCSARSEIFWNLSAKAIHIDVLPRSTFFLSTNKRCILFSCTDQFLELRRKHCILFSRAANILELQTKALYFVQPRGVKFWNYQQKKLR